MKKTANAAVANRSETKVAVIGASGYVGEELVRLLLRHPYADLAAVTSRQFAGKTLADIFPRLSHHQKAGDLRFGGQSVETGSDNDITTIKYSPDGDVLWTRHYNGPANGYDAGQAIAVDANGNAYVTGNHTTATGLDCATLKYSTNGELLWTASYNGPDNGGDVLISIALDDLQDVYVSGFLASGGASDFVTIKYDTTGVEQWVQLYNGPGNSYDGTYAIGADNNRDVLVTGYSTGADTDYDYTTIKYVETATPTPTPIPTPKATLTPRPAPSPRPRPTPRPRP